MNRESIFKYQIYKESGIKCITYDTVRGIIIIKFWQNGSSNKSGLNHTTSFQKEVTNRQSILQPFCIKFISFSQSNILWIRSYHTVVVKSQGLLTLAQILALPLGSCFNFLIYVD